MTPNRTSRLAHLVEHNETGAGRIFDLVIQALILISLVTFSIETLPDLTPRAQRILDWIEAGSVAVFTFEYALRLAVAKPRLRFATSFYGVIDLLAILPFYLSLGVDMRSLRALRLFRLLRAFKLLRYSRALKRMHRAFAIAREELVLFLFAAAILIYFAAVGIYYFENPVQPEVFASVFDGLWWAVATLTTVGYGDVYPVTAGGRLFAVIVLMLGLGVVAVPTGLVSSALGQARDEEVEARSR
ncbi:ion transporter [Engelhardtia mirabilis]|uniref:Cyclic nucleotide-gated potassium channel n=1 Tax=Engelhardtia mirabilis TaxID=2528011 RepID=A0A518BNK1_9BACT|nr:Cyclic nucleotide-gated potassium channel [Planctomycetes bacterium Pla133]QDV02838.1 Cyclic nucleotide-gated potassium channel [Planctomycetes bacterium Pla86]